MESEPKNHSNNSEDQANVHQEKLARCESEVQQLRDSLMRVGADFENFKRRTIKERSSWVDEARADVLCELLSIIDNFDRAFDQSKVVNDQDQKLEVWMQGFAMIRKSLHDLLARYDVRQMSTDLKFDPQYHEAISQVASQTVPSGEIVEVVQSGYLIKDRVLRVARVVVAA